VLIYTDAAAENMEVGSDFMQELELDELKKAFESGGIEECRAMLERKRDEWKSIAVNVAVIGGAGVGKSSFINAIRRLTADDEGAAAVGVTETTLEIRSYDHPDNPMLKFWDLPGVGTDRFPRETYLDDIGVHRFDFLLLLTAVRFMENDTWLGREFLKQNKKYFFVRTKIGVDVKNDKKAHPKSHNEEALIKDRIREPILKQLREDGCENVPVFLIDSHKLKKFDFEQLERRIVEELPKLKRTALVLSLRATSEEMIRLKVAELRSGRWKAVALAGCKAAVPVPGVPVAFVLDVVLKESLEYFTQLGLDETSLERYADLISCDYQHLKSIVGRRLGYAFLEEDGIRNLIAKLIRERPHLFRTLIVGETFRCVLPVFGSLVSAPCSIAATDITLKLMLNEMESVALEIVTAAAETAADAELSDSDED